MKRNCHIREDTNNQFSNWTDFTLPGSSVSRNDTLLATYHYLADGTKYKVMDPDNNGRVYIGPFSYTTAKAGNTVYSYLEGIDTNCQNNTIPLHRENPLKHFSFIINKKTDG